MKIRGINASLKVGIDVLEDLHAKAEALVKKYSNKYKFTDKERYDKNIEIGKFIFIYENCYISLKQEIGVNRLDCLDTHIKTLEEILKRY